ncbi:MAG: class I SAM-dependent RNA methyltransferase [Spirochaetes bacterium]|nr:class I SAM-dependent RNA methyltransferase [Spirochaetota bacterium]
MQTLQVKIEKATFGGFGLGFHYNTAIFVWGSIPGEIVEVKITKQHSSYAFAEIVKIHRSSPHRIFPACPNFGICGGCDYLHMEYSQELCLKKEIITDTLARIGKISFENQPQIEIASSHRFGYRTHAEIKFSHHGVAGFYRKESNDVIPFPKAGCALLADSLNAGIELLKDNTASQCKIAINSNNQFFSSMRGKPIIFESVSEIVFERPINCFFQANRFLRERMVSLVCKYANMDHSKKFIDVACGVGFFTLHLAKASHFGIGFDISKENIQWARHNARINNIYNVEFHTANFSSLPITDDNYRAVILDPPRGGLSKKARKTIIYLAPERIVYVSCNPTTFSRDTADFIRNGYRLSQLSFIDMFPGTHHIELVGLFERCV